MMATTITTMIGGSSSSSSSINEDNNTPPHTPRRRRGDSSPRSSPPKRARRESPPPPPPIVPVPRSCLLAHPPADVAELRARIERRAVDFSGLERCPWAQTAHAMQVAADAGAADPVGTTNHAVRWLMLAAGNPFWFSVGLRSAVAGHRNALAHELIGDASLWRPDLLATTECAPCGGGGGGIRSSSSSGAATTANVSALRHLRRSTAAARARAAVWGPFSAGFYCGPDDDDDDDAAAAAAAEQQEREEEAARRPAARCFHDAVAHVPSVLMLDAALHGNVVAAGYIARAFAPHTWRLEGSWTLPRVEKEEEEANEQQQHDDEDEADEDQDQDAAAAFVSSSASFVPTTVIVLGRRTVRATDAVPARSSAALARRVRAGLRAMEQTLLPRLREAPAATTAAAATAATA